MSSSKQWQDLERVLEKMWRKLFDEGKISSVEEFFDVVVESSVEVFHMSKSALKKFAQELIDDFPKDANAALEFVLKHVLPILLHQVPGKDTCRVIGQFVLEALQLIIKKGGTINGTAFTGVVKSAITHCVSTTAAQKAMMKTTEEIVSEATEMTTKSGFNLAQHAGKTKSIQSVVYKEAAKVGMKTVAMGGLKAAGISAVIGGVFLYRDLISINKQYKEEEREMNSNKEFKEEERKMSINKQDKEEERKMNINKQDKEEERRMNINTQDKEEELKMNINKQDKEEERKMNINKQDKEEERKMNINRKIKINEKIGEYLGSVVGSGLAGAALCFGPVGWAGLVASIVVGSLVSYGAGKVGGIIGRNV